MSIDRILIVDDELLMRNFLTEALKRQGYEISTAACGEQAEAILKDQSFDLVITDMKMPDRTGIDILKFVKQISPQTLVIVITAFGSVENAVDAMRLGAFHYLIKPFTPDTIEAVLDKAREHVSLVEENRYLRQQVSSQGARSVGRVIGESPIMKRILSDVQRVAKSNASVFINGESGTGKEVIAHAIHFNSHRAHRPFIRVNCAAIPESLIESEFFGHEKGAFTGANLRRMGRFELAHGGTLLLDEITEIPPGLQAQLLRVIQEQEFERVGGSKLVRVDVRLVSTSNRNMREAVQEKIFREDLYYRLNVVPIFLPPLRDRREDILPLSEYFLESLCQENHKASKTLAQSARDKLLAYHWPGNIRELANIIERAVVMDYDDVIEAEHLIFEPGENILLSTPSVCDLPNLPVGVTLAELEKRLILETLQAKDDNRTRTAETLGISIRTLRN
ncbi:MAG: sigma-54-dependent Fis family transcriptional regulator, partial [Chlamydiia bacterium]|nr:sigma-54-dependent Fis family transcriptional regulator [Chlamydiia bacterium]